MGEEKIKVTTQYLQTWNRELNDMIRSCMTILNENREEFTKITEVFMVDGINEVVDRYLSEAQKLEELLKGMDRSADVLSEIAFIYEKTEKENVNATDD